MTEATFRPARRLVALLAGVGAMTLGFVVVPAGAAADTSPPSVPQNLRLVSNTDTSITMAWGASTDNVAVRSYAVHNANNDSVLAVVTTRTWTHAGLWPNTGHNYYVTATDTSGNRSRASNILFAAAAYDRVAPTRPTGLVGHFNRPANTVSLTWIASTDDVRLHHYDVYRAVGSTLIKIGTSTTATFTDRSPVLNAVNSYFVIAFDAFANMSPPSSSVWITTGTAAPTVPSPARFVSPVPGNAAATVRWAAPLSDGGSQITGYVVTTYVGLVPQASYTFGSKATTRVIAGLVNGRTYAFKVAAKNAIGRGPASPLSAAITVGAPTAPTNVSAAASAGSAYLRWSAPKSNNGAPVTAYVATAYVSGVARTQALFAGSARRGIVRGLVNGRTYRFRLVAINARGTGPRSVASNAVTA